MARKKQAVAQAMYNNNSWGLIFGVFMGGLHALWAILVGAGLAQVFIDWIFALHMIRPPYVIAPFDALTAIMLVVVTFIIGYVGGWIFAAICNAFCKK